MVNSQSTTFLIFEYLIDEGIRNAFKTQEPVLGFVVETELPPALTWLSRVIVKMHPAQGFNSSARYEYDLNATDEQRKDSDLIVDLFMPQDYTTKEVSKFRYSIESNIRHELEHSGQETSELMSVQSVIQSEKDIWKSLRNAWSYYASSAEVSAHVAGWVLKAKRSHKNINDILYHELYRIYATGIEAGYPEEDMSLFMKKLSEVYYDYLEKRWPRI